MNKIFISICLAFLQACAPPVGDMEVQQANLAYDYESRFFLEFVVCQTNKGQKAFIEKQKLWTQRLTRIAEKTDISCGFKSYKEKEVSLVYTFWNRYRVFGTLHDLGKNVDYLFCVKLDGVELKDPLNLDDLIASISNYLTNRPLNKSLMKYPPLYDVNGEPVSQHPAAQKLFPDFQDFPGPPN